MKILHVLRSEAWGGLELYALEFIQRLHEQGLNSSLVAQVGSRVEKEAKLRGIPLVGSHWHAADYTHLHVHRRQDLAGTRWKIAFKKTPLVYSLYMSAKPKNDIYHAWIYKRVGALVSSSEWVTKEIIKNYPCDKESVHLIRYGRKPVTEWMGVSERAQLRNKISGATEQDLVLLSMCRLDPGKGLRELVEAAKLVAEPLRKRLHIWLMGDPTLLGLTKSGEPIYEDKSQQLSNDLKREVQELAWGGRLQMIPFQKDPTPFLQSCDINFLGSYEETYSLAVVDAMLAGKTCLGTQSGGTVEQIGLLEERGFFFKPLNVLSLQQALQKVLATPAAEIAARGQLARAWSEQEHNWSQCLSTWQKLYNDLT